MNVEPLRVLQEVDLQQTLGTWYEIASFPKSFQHGCSDTTATSSGRGDAEIEALNRCRKSSFAVGEKWARGLIWVVDPASSAKLEVSFFRPFWGDFWIVDLSPGYGYAAAGRPTRDFLRILRRSPTLDPLVYESTVGRLSAQGYETERLVRTSHGAH